VEYQRGSLFIRAHDRANSALSSSLPALPDHPRSPSALTAQVQQAAYRQPAVARHHVAVAPSDHSKILCVYSSILERSPPVEHRIAATAMALAA